MTSIGRPGDPAAVRSLTFDHVAATYVVDGILTMRPATFFPDIPSDYWSARPELCTATGDLVMSAGGLLVESDGETVLIDAGVGTTAKDFAFGSVDCGSLLDVLATLGRRPEDIDVVAFTHLHFDHAGWAYANGDKTFPNARYVVAAKEWAPYASGDYRVDSTTPRHVISQWVVDRSRVELIDDGVEIAAGVHAVVTPGHTPGHTSYVIASRGGQRLVVLGDAFHSVAQLTHQRGPTDAPRMAVGRRLRRERSRQRPAPTARRTRRAGHARVRLPFRRSALWTGHHGRHR
jgi:glyoxylase-like metal-dependent hydrolase (beta-lactamase superfamily II)